MSDFLPAPSRLIGKPDHLGLDLAHLLQFFPYVFHLLLLPGLDECHFFLGVIELDVGVHIQGDGNVAVPHQVLESLGTDPGEGHIGAVGMATNMGRNPGKLIFIDAVVFPHDKFEIMFPVQGYCWMSIHIIKKEFPHPIDDGFYLRRSSPLQDGGKALVDLIGHGQQPGPRFGFCRKNVIFSIPLLELFVHVDRPFFQIDIVHRQSAEF